MMIMDKTMTPEAVYYSAFFMGLAGLIMVVIGVFVKRTRNLHLKKTKSRLSMTRPDVYKRQALSLHSQTWSTAYAWSFATYNIVLT